MLSACLKRGWSSVLFDGSSLPSVEENKRQTIEVVAEARALRRRCRGRDRGHQGRRGRRRLGRESPTSIRWRPRSTSSARPAWTSSRRRSATPTASTRATPVLNAQRVSDIVAQVPLPMCLHGGTGLSAGPVRRPDRPRLRQGQHFHRAEDRLHGGEQGLLPGEAEQHRSADAAEVRCASGSSRWRSTTSAPSTATAKRRERADLRLRRRAFRHRAGRPPARLQPDLPRVRPARAMVGGGVRPSGCASAAARSAWRAC